MSIVKLVQNVQIESMATPETNNFLVTGLSDDFWSKLSHPEELTITQPGFLLLQRAGPGGADAAQLVTLESAPKCIMSLPRGPVVSVVPVTTTTAASS